MLRRLRLACCPPSRAAVFAVLSLVASACLSQLPENRDEIALELLIGFLVGNNPDFSATRVSRSSPQSIASGVDTALAFDQIDFATGSFAVVPATNNLVVRTEDLYLLNGGVEFQAHGVGSRTLRFLDPAAVAGTQSTRGLFTSTTAHSISMLRELSAGATIAVQASQTSGSAVDTTSEATTQLSLTRLNRAVASAAFVRKTAVQAVSASIQTAVTFQTVDYDTGGYYSAAQQDRLTIQESGVYLIVGNARLGVTGVAGTRGVDLLVNSATGSSFTIARDQRSAAATGEGNQDVSAVYSLNAGDSVSLRYYHNNAGAHNLEFPLTSMGIARLDSNPVSSRSVLRRSAPAAVQSIPAGVATAVVLSEVERADAAFSATDTTTTTIAETGFYLLVASAEFVNQNFARRDLNINVNGSAVAREARLASTTGNGSLNLLHMQQLNAGDTVQLRMFQNTGGNLDLISANSFLQIVKLD